MPNNSIEEIVRKAHLQYSDGVPFVQASNLSRSDYMRQNIVNWINTFESILPANMEAAIRFSSYAGVFTVDGIGCIIPDLLIFHCRNSSGSSTTLLQHITQVNLALEAVQRKGELSAPRRKIGFAAIQGQEPEPSE